MNHVKVDFGDLKLKFSLKLKALSQLVMRETNFEIASHVIVQPNENKGMHARGPARIVYSLTRY